MWTTLPPDGSDALGADLVTDVRDRFCDLRDAAPLDLDDSGEADLVVGVACCSEGEGTVYGLYGPLEPGSYGL